MKKNSVKNSYVEVDLSAVKHNLKTLKGYLGRYTKQMAVIKSDAYGHGAVEVAKTLEKEIAWFAVNDVDEGIELRKGGIRAPVLVFGIPKVDTVSTYRDYKLTATISSVEHFDLLSRGTEYHLNFDTGMRRLGFFPEQAEEVKDLASKHSELNCTGIYSHFATAADPGSQKVFEQLKQFESIRSVFDDALLTHMANTGATAFYPDSHFDMVRNGIGMYGYAPGGTEIEGLKPAIGWKSYFAQIKTVAKGETVSYGATWECPDEGYMGVIPAGYAEGIPRILSGNLEIAVNEKLYPVAGTVTMNYIMVYLGKDKFEVGQPVEILGGSALTAGEWAKRTGTIPYEIVCNIKKGIPRVYK